MAKQRKRAAPKMDIQIMYFRPKRSPKDRSEFLRPPKRETETNETESPEWKVQICASSKVK
jgi:hypothetical protein